MSADPDDAVDALNRILAAWREPGLIPILPSRAFPDAVNRGGVGGGVSIEHAHGIACAIVSNGFDERHDVPVVRRVSARALEDDPGYLRWVAHATANAAVLPDPRRAAAGEHAFATLGSTHFMLALRLIESDVASVFGARVSYGVCRKERGVREAIEEGVPSVIIREDCPRDARKTLSRLLNSAEDLGFRLDPETGFAVRVSRGGNNEAVRDLTVFEALSRTLDAEELSSLARVKYGLSLADAESGWVTVAAPEASRSRL